MLGDRKLTAMRPGVGTYVDGYYQPAVDTQIDFVGSPQPLSARESEVLSEGDRQKEWIKIYTKTELKGQREESGVLYGSDRVTVDGRVYVVIRVWPYTMPGSVSLRHFKVEACLENINTNNQPEV